MIVQVMAISNLVLTRQIYSKETNGAHAHYREPVPLTFTFAPIFNFKVRSYRTANTVIFMGVLFQLRSSLWYVNTSEKKYEK